jgi:pimeloyl-ACP methyl ester carboxylesterase
VLGYSSGSRIAETYVSMHPEHVSKAIFLCPLTIKPQKRRGLAFGLWLDSRISGFGAWILSGSRLKFLISLLGFNLRRDARSPQWYAEISAAPVSVLKDTVRAVADRVSDGFSVPVPYAMIWGDRDLVPFTPRVAGEHDYFIHARHAAPVEAAQEIAAVVIRFLK